MNSSNIPEEFSNFNYKIPGYEVEKVLYANFEESKQYPVVIYTKSIGEEILSVVMRIFNREGKNKFNCIIEKEYTNGYKTDNYKFAKDSLSNGKELLFVKSSNGSGSYLFYEIYGDKNGQISLLKNGENLPNGLVELYKDQLIESQYSTMNETCSAKIYLYKDSEFRPSRLNYTPDYKDKIVDIYSTNEELITKPRIVIMRLGERVKFRNNTNRKIDNFLEFYKPEKSGALFYHLFSTDKSNLYGMLPIVVFNEDNKTSEDTSDFKWVIKKFVTDPEFQKSRIIFPIVDEFIGPDKSTVEHVGKDKYIVENIREVWVKYLKNEGEQLYEESRIKEDECVYIIGQDGSGLGSEYHFTLYRGKWMLTKLSSSNL
jgi:hypothetical protein